MEVLGQIQVGAVDNPSDAFHQPRDQEVDQKIKLQAGQLSLGQDLCPVDRQQCFN